MRQSTLFRIGLISYFIFFSTACSLLNNPMNGSPTCRELKKQMLMNGSTSDRTTALQQQAESSGIARAYRNEGC